MFFLWRYIVTSLVTSVIAAASSERLSPITLTSAHVLADGSVVDGSGTRFAEPPEDSALVEISSNASKSPPKKKTKFLAAVPMILKFFMFWWCVLLFIGACLVILDHIFLRFISHGHPVFWTAKHEFNLKETAIPSLAAYRDELWSMLVEVPRWNQNTHPTLLQAEIVGRIEC